LSEALSQESQFVGGDERRSYDYSSALERVGTVRKPDGASGEAPYRAYSLDANGSVEGLQDDTGDDSDRRYFYDPYGQALNSGGDPMDDTDEAALPEDQQANPFRFQSHYYDAASQSYDMKARAYLPAIGRFLQEDHYEAALGDQALETDPLTQDRYAFAAANPTTNIEFDGHRVCNGAHDCGGSSREASRRNSNFENQQAVFSPTEQIQWNNAVNEGAREARSRGRRNRRAAAINTLKVRPLFPGGEPEQPRISPRCPPAYCDPNDDDFADFVESAGCGVILVCTGNDPVGTLAGSLIGFGKVKTAFRGAKSAVGLGGDGRRIVVGKMDDLTRSTRRPRPWERALADDLPDQGSRAANWSQNRRKLREVMAARRPIRDASVNRLTGALRRLDPPGFAERTFLQMERDYLHSEGWRYSRVTHKWHPPR
jgi:RHS repeat-associated protein